MTYTFSRNSFRRQLGAMRIFIIYKQPMIAGQGLKKS